MIHFTTTVTVAELTYCATRNGHRPNHTNKTEICRTAAERHKITRQKAKLVITQITTVRLYNNVKAV